MLFGMFVYGAESIRKFWWKKVLEKVIKCHNVAPNHHKLSCKMREEKDENYNPQPSLCFKPFLNFTYKDALTVTK